MAKFCIHCGSQLEEGQNCTCEASQASQKVTVASAPVNQSSFNFGDFFKSMLNVSLEFIKSPVAVVKKAAQSEDYKLGLFFIVLQALLTALFAIASIKEMEGLAESFFGNMANLFARNVKDLEIPYLSIFMKTTLVMIVQYVAIIGILYGVSKLAFKAQGSFKSLINSVGVATVPLIYALVVSIAAIFIFPKLITYLMMFGCLFTIVCSFVAVRESLDISEDSALYSTTISYIVYYFIIISIIAQKIESSTRGMSRYFNY